MVTPFIVWYLFLAGTGGGAFFIGAVVDLFLRFRDDPWLIEVSRITDRGMPIGAALVVIGAVFLLLDLGSPDRVFEVFQAPPSNLLSLGSWLIALFTASALPSFAIGVSRRAKDFRAVETVSHIIASISSLGIIVYSGVYLSLFPTIPFLNTPFVPLLFIASALSTGLAATLLGNFLVHDLTVSSFGLRWCLKADSFLLIIEAVLLAVFLVVSQTDGPIAQANSATLLSGHLALLFWGGCVATGLLAPFIAGIHQLRSVSWPSYALGSCCSLVGGLCLRYAVLLSASRLSIIDPGILTIWG